MHLPTRSHPLEFRPKDVSNIVKIIPAGSVLALCLGRYPLDFGIRELALRLGLGR